MRILFDNNVPVGVRDFLTKHEVRTIVEMNWPPQLENGELLKVEEAAGFDVLVTSKAAPSSYCFIEMLKPPRPPNRSI